MRARIIGAAHKDSAGHVLDVAAPAERHGDVELLADDLQTARHARLQPAPSPYRKGRPLCTPRATQRQPLDHIPAGADAPVHVNFQLLPDSVDKKSTTYASTSFFTAFCQIFAKSFQLDSSFR